MSVATATRQMGAHRRIQAYKDIGAILGAGGVDYAIIPLGDSKFENAARTTIQTVGSGAGDGLVFTYSEARTAFDSATKQRRNQIHLSEIPFNGTDEEADAPDAPFWSRDDAGGANGFSVGVWANVTDTAGFRIMLSKWDDTALAELREWDFLIDSVDKLSLNFFDESADVSVKRASDAAITQGKLQFFVGTYDGVGGGSAADGITLYAKGAVLASTATNNGSYVGMEAQAVKPALGRVFGSGGFFDGNMLGCAIGPFLTHQKLVDSQVERLFSIGVAAQG